MPGAKAATRAPPRLPGGFSSIGSRRITPFRGYDVPFRYYFCQREAIETLAWLVEVAGQRDAKALIEAHCTISQKDLISKNIEFQTTMDGKRQVRRYVPELGRDGVQDLPPENLPRFAFKMATGSGKTWVMAMAIVWPAFTSCACRDRNCRPTS